MTTSKTKTYNRDAAILYAQKWANSFNPQYPNFEKIGVENSDCANFLSVFICRRACNEKRHYEK